MAKEKSSLTQLLTNVCTEYERNKPLCVHRRIGSKNKSVAVLFQRMFISHNAQLHRSCEIMATNLKLQMSPSVSSADVMKTTTKNRL